MNHRMPGAGLLLACGLALLTAGCATAPTQAAYADTFRTYTIIAADDAGVLSPPEFDKVQIGIVQYLVSEGLVHDGQVFVPDARHADVVFRVTIAWQGPGDSFAIVAVTQTYNGAAVDGETPADLGYSGVPYDPWYEAEDYGYPDFGCGYEPYLPLIGVGAWIPFLGHPYRGWSRPPGDRDHDRDRGHRPPPRDRNRPGDTWAHGRRPPAPPPIGPGGPDSAKHRPPPVAWHPGEPGPRPPAARPPERPPDRSGSGHRPPPRHPPGDRQPPPDRPGPPTAVASRPPPPRPPVTVAVTPRPPPPASPPRASTNHRADPPRTQRMESGARSMPPPSLRSASPAVSRSSDSGGRSSSPAPSHSDSGSSGSGGGSGSSRSGGDSGSSRSGGDSGSSRSGGDSDRHQR